MEKEFVPCNLALELKELGFDEPCFRFKNNISNVFEQKIEGYDWNQVEKFVSIPTFSQAFRFFREKYKLHLTITSISQESWQWHITKPGESLGKLYEEDFYTYEDAEIDGLKKLIELVKN